MPTLLNVPKVGISRACCVVLIALVLLCAELIPTVASAQAVLANTPLSNRARLNTSVQEQANSVLAIMSYTTVPDVTTSSLSINNGATGNPGFGQTQLGGGFTLGKSFPLYLEGTVALSRYDHVRRNRWRPATSAARQMGHGEYDRRHWLGLPHHRRTESPPNPERHDRPRNKRPAPRASSGQSRRGHQSAVSRSTNSGTPAKIGRLVKQ